MNFLTQINECFYGSKLMVLKGNIVCQDSSLRKTVWVETTKLLVAIQITNFCCCFTHIFDAENKRNFYYIIRKFYWYSKFVYDEDNRAGLRNN